MILLKDFSVLDKEYKPYSIEKSLKFLELLNAAN